VILVDTGIWVASANPHDRLHGTATNLVHNSPDDLVTTDYIVDESLTLLRSRRRPAAAIMLGERLFGGAITDIHHVEPNDVREAWQIFQQFRDKEWSFTDCVSYVVMQRLNIRTAYSFDHHFHQFGTVNVLPQ
jgi:uncharacterized protein